MPENFVDSQEFEDTVREEFNHEVHARLLNKEWFKKVDAIEMFCNFWTIGRSVGKAPPHNKYIPVSHTIMPKPRLGPFSKDDQIGKEYRYRTPEMHTHHRARFMPDTLKPQPF